MIIMLGYRVFIFASLLPYNLTAVTLNQLEPSITKTPERTAKFTCSVSGVANLDNAIIHWYRARADQAPERILYYSSGRAVHDEGFSKAKYSAEKDNNFILRLSNVAEEDNGYYYCAYWDVHSGAVLCKACGVGTVTLEQPEASITKTLGKIVRLTCRVSGVSVVDAAIHWYRDRPSEGMKRILYYSTQVNHDSGFTKDRFAAEKDGGSCSLIIPSVIEDDSGDYYCAYWDSHSDAELCNVCTKLPEGRKPNCNSF
nr:PREDICTED: uncharacterized protein LOC102356082 [Latimeria chalumnae]|eukprot:XP_014352980.1 PREDICTED: uncharacterized protein LOC102356082 [Latimeria chalumnae]